MLLGLYRTAVNKLYSLYTPIRRYRANKAMEYKHNRGYNSGFAKNEIPLSEVAEKLKQAGIMPDDTVFMRCSMPAAQAFQGGAMAFLKELIDYFSPDGTLVMASYTFDKSPIMVLAENPVFDRETTIDRLNLLSEIFRRTPGVKRSIHPTHSLCAIGKHADWLLADHHKSDFCYSPDSPFARLIEVEAKEISIGVFPTSITFHYMEQFCPKSATVFSDLPTPIMCRVIIDGKEEVRPYKMTDHFVRYDMNYKVFENTDAQPKRHYFGAKLDFYTVDLHKRVLAMKQLISENKFWYADTHKIQSFVLRHIIKPMVLAAYFDKIDGKLYPVKGK